MRGLVSLVILGLLGAGGWIAYQIHDERAQIDRELKEKTLELALKTEEIGRLSKENQRLDLALRLLKVDHRVAEITVLEREVSDLQESLATRKSVDRAKSVLQEKLGLSEPDAFRWIQKTAMDLRLSMRQVSDGVVEHGPGGAGG